MPRRQFQVPSGPYPMHGLLPKDETQASAFLKQYPEYDGRNIRVAVLDTGVDPAAFGLNGKGKMVDIIDCTGSGDIPLKAVEPNSAAATKTAADNAISLPGLSGRSLLVSPSWSNPTGKWKVGLKRAFDLWPRDLVKRRKQERQPEWDVKIAKLLSEAKKSLDDFARETQAKKSANSKQAKADDAQSRTSAATEKLADKGEERDSEAQRETEPDSIADKLKKAELEARLSYLTDFSLDDPGPILDAVVWHDGKDWRCVVGGAEGDGEQNIAALAEDNPAILDLRNHKPMTDFRKEKHYEQFGTQDLMSYSVNIVDNGDILSLVAVSGTHGTHVAAIIGGHIDGNSDLSGVAPGVEMVSLKIGDTRVGSLETGQALLRATKAILDTGCDICNMSYGEDAAWGMEDKGQFVQLLRDEVIKRRNVLFVAAAGNAGPALSTIGAPSTTSGIISVGAYETPAMQQAEYALLDVVPEGPYTWSSRGPTYDGANVVVYAPGAAITGVPTYNLQRSQLMNGTSMASPNACGAIALVLSALKAEKIQFSPTSVIKAIGATSKDVDDPQNVGLIQVEALHKYLIAHTEHPDVHADFEISVIRQGNPAPVLSKPIHERGGDRGIYLRELAETSRLLEAAVWVKPTFSTDRDTEKLYNLDIKLAISATEAWVRAPSFLSLPGGGRNFNIRVDPTQLPPGLHYAEIRAYDSSTPGRLVFMVPVTVCKPEVVTAPTHSLKEWKSSPGHIERRFLAVPEGATQAEMRVTSRHHDSPVNLWVHCVQIQAEKRLSRTEQQSILALTAGETIVKTFEVSPGLTMEVCAAQFWNSLPVAEFTVEFQFHGLNLDTGKSVYVVGGGEFPRLQLSSKIRLENISPSISFDRTRTCLRPTKSEVTPLGERDVMPDGKRLYQLVNTYTFKLTEKTKIKPFWPITDNLYDTAMTSLSVILDSRQKLVQFGTCYAQESELEKGEYTAKLQLQHHDYKALEARKGFALTLEAQLSEKLKKLTLSVHRDHMDAQLGSEGLGFKNNKIPLGEARSIVLNTDLKGDASDLYKVAKAGDSLLGKFNLSPKATVDITYLIPPQSKSKEEEEGSKDDPSLIDLQLSIVEKIKSDDEKSSFLEQLMQSHGSYLPLLVVRLKSLKKDAKVEEINKAADAVLAQIDETEMSSYFGKKTKPAAEQSSEEKKVHKAWTEKKAAWTAALGRKLSTNDTSGVDQEGLYTKYYQFLDTPDKDQEFLLHQAKRDMKQKRYASALKTLGKMLPEASDKAKYAEITELQRSCLRHLDWLAISEYEARWRLTKEPTMDLVW